MPQALPFIVLAVAAAGTGVAVAGQIEQAKAAEKAGKYNERVAENNAQAAADQARFEADQIRRKNLLVLGRQKAVFAKSGILDSGSATDIFLDSATQGELDALAAQYSGEVAVGNYRARAQIARMEGDSMARAGYYRAGGTLLSGVSSAVGGYYSSTRTGYHQPSFED